MTTMALLARLFSPRNVLKKEKAACNPNQISRNESRTGNCNKSEIRVLIFRECDWRGRKLLFDSTSVEKVPFDITIPIARPRRNSAEPFVEVSNGYGYKYTKPLTDTNSLGETIFGSVAMATRGPSIKVHSLKEPARVMFTKVTTAPRCRIRRRQNSDNNTQDNSQGSSMNSLGSRYDSGSFDSKPGSFDTRLGDSGFGGGKESSTAVSHPNCGTYCPLHSHTLDGGDHVDSSSSLQSGCSLSSMRRRWARSVATTLDFADAAHSPPSGGKRTKLGIAVIVTLTGNDSQDTEQYLLDRLPLVNNILTRLQHSTERAYCRRDVFVQSMFQASLHAFRSVTELLSRARLDKPLWLTLTSDRTDTRVKTALANGLVNDLAHLLTTIDTKHTNFFISTLVTAVLTHHLGWVPTVFNNLPAHSQSLTSFVELSRNHPYNPLWAQLSDLHGALGYPPKIAKTVVVGKSEILVEKLLSILSYFIRCGHISAASPECEDHPEEESLLEHLIDSGQCEEFNKEAIQEFSKAGSGNNSASKSTSTLTKSKTVLSMKTFSVTDTDVDNSNSLESGFESYNEFSGESCEDRMKVAKSTLGSSCKLAKTSSSANLMETSFSKNIISDFNFDQEMMSKPCDILTSDLQVVKLLETDNIIRKMDSEKQYTSAHLLNLANNINSNSSMIKSESIDSSFIRKNLFQADIIGTEDKENKVVFVLGDNEELVNIKGQGEYDVTKAATNPAEDTVDKSRFKPPIILIDPDGEECDLSGERYETETKTDFVAGSVSDKVVIIQSTPIEMEGCTESDMFKTFSLHRCISVPEEAVSETDWVKRQRSKEAVKLIRRWLSDSAIELNTHRPLSEITDDKSMVRGGNNTPASVFRPSVRPLKDRAAELDASVSQLTDEVEFNVPILAVEDLGEEPAAPAEEFITLPHKGSTERAQCNTREVDVAASLFGGVSDKWSPELVLQGVTQAPADWLAELRRTLLLEAHSGEMENDLAEAVCILANTDTWEVSVISSHSHVEDGGMRVGMSHLVANMLETLQHLDSLSVPTHQCLGHVESKLQELCVRSQALAELLLVSDFLDMATLTAMLDLEANDVPLLLSVASTHTPLVTRKYGLSFL